MASRWRRQALSTARQSMGNPGYIKFAERVKQA